MLLFALYAFGVWLLCFRWRRQWQGFVALASGVLLVVTLAMLDRRLREWGGERGSGFTSLQFLLWVESGIIALVGLFICVLPKGYAKVPCRKCGYELAGLEQENPRCPECGIEFAVTAPAKRPQALRAAEEPVQRAHDQDQRG